jgi:two-component system CAI-1 autoinducer sensor kinase/phosphatase CqsS
MVPLDRWWFHSAKTRLSRWLLDEIVHAPSEPILHPSRERLQWLGAFTLIGHTFFAYLWGALIPQPYENVAIRLLIASMGLSLLLPAVNRDLNARLARWVFSLCCWLQLPLYFFWMYWMNHGNAVWLASVACMVVIYYHLTDWRIASLGMAGGILLSYLVASPSPLAVPDPALGLDHLVVLGFAWASSILLGASSANLRRTRLVNALSTMAVMAHELRTPLATVNLMGDVLRTLARNDLPENKSRKIDDLATRLQNLVRSMNRQIDTQMSNAQLMRLPRELGQIDAADLVNEVIKDYPYRSSRERDCVRLHVQSDFSFLGSRALFTQVLTNLLKNALHSLASASSAPKPGDLRLDVGLHHGKGRIAVSDHGVGIGHEQKSRIFEPFFSTQSGVGHGLGLTFCKNVVEAANGSISVHAEPTMGAVFMIDLPLHAPIPGALRPA